jgi:hypothetical protein
MIKQAIVIFLLLCTSSAYAQKNIILITIDGLRWQEVFRGADQALINNKKFVNNSQTLKEKFWHNKAEIRREKLMPFLWQTINKQGVLIGNRDINSKMSVANNWYFSYPGYSEIFTGIVDKNLNSNKKIPNPNLSFLEWLNNKEQYQQKIAAFGSWDVFPYILNTQRSKLTVNAGFMPAKGYPLSDEVKLLNQLQQEIPSPWHNVRLDSFTYRFAKDYLLKQRPKVMSISFGETDDFAHDGHYDQYLLAAKRTDDFIKDLWQTIEKTPGYKNNTILIITTDHGRGNTEKDWQHHASKQATQGYLKRLKDFPSGIVGSNNIWLAALGLDNHKTGQLVPKKEIKQQQIAATLLTLLGENPTAFNNKAAPAIKELL